MRAAILTELNKDFEVRDDVELDGPGPGEVRIRMVASGVCHSDVSFQNGTIPIPLPSVVGHEGAGEVLAVGDGVEHVGPGDNVIISWVPPCGSCFFCLAEQSNLCMTGLIKAAVPHFKLVTSSSSPAWAPPPSPRRRWSPVSLPSRSPRRSPSTSHPWWAVVS